jgi:hypothetical protein
MESGDFVMDKDRSIIIQVAAKIASELTNKEASSENKIGEYALMFDSVKGILLESIYGDTAQVEAAVQTLESSFGAVTQVESAPTSSQSVRVRGKQHGELPNWLITACKADNITEVFDNRDGLAANAKRPWFKATAGDKAFWPPKGA